LSGTNESENDAMREVFEVAEMVRISIEDERTGVAFYSTLTQLARTPDMRKLFAGLAEQEKFHQKRFEDMFKAMGSYQPKEQYPGEYMTYVRTLADTRAFPDEQTACRMAHQCTSDAQAVELASRFERDTLMLFNEIRGLLDEKDKAVIETIIREEQAHLVTLAEARVKLGKQA
jgi:rubrerythrin